mgnify:CR=1 FL=1
MMKSKFLFTPLLQHNIYYACYSDVKTSQIINTFTTTVVRNTYKLICLLKALIFHNTHVVRDRRYACVPWSVNSVSNKNGGINK